MKLIMVKQIFGRAKLVSANVKWNVIKSIGFYEIEWMTLHAQKFKSDCDKIEFKQSELYKSKID